MKGDIGVSLIRSVVSKGKDRVELRDEIYCQLLRLSNGSPSLDNTLRAWAVMAVCSVAYTPSHTLLKVRSGPGSSVRVCVCVCACVCVCDR